MGQSGSGLSGPGVRGLKNLDSTCYMNVGLQCLFQTPGLTAVLWDQWKTKTSLAGGGSAGGGEDSTRICPELRGGRESIVEKYLDLAELVWDSRGVSSCVSPEELKRTIDKLDPRYRGCTEQRDAVDFFLNVFIKHLHSDVKVPYNSSLTDRGGSATVSAATATGTTGAGGSGGGQRMAIAVRRSTQIQSASTYPRSKSSPAKLSLSNNDSRTNAATANSSSSSSGSSSNYSKSNSLPPLSALEATTYAAANPRNNRRSGRPPMASASAAAAAASAAASSSASCGCGDTFVLLPRPGEGKFPDKETMNKAARAAWRKYLKRQGRSFFTDNFQGQSIRYATCERCKRQSVDFPAFQFLPLAPPPTQSTVRLVDLFAKLPMRHCKGSWTCPACGSKGTPVKIREGIWKLPNLLMVLIQRVMQTSRNILIKNKTEVWVPKSGLDLSSLPKSPGIPSEDDKQQEESVGQRSCAGETKREITGNGSSASVLRQSQSQSQGESQSQCQGKRDRPAESGFSFSAKATGSRGDFGSEHSSSSSSSSSSEAQASSSSKSSQKSKREFPDADMDYDLYAILSHSGTPNRGHYVAHVRNFRSGNWHTFNDGKIRPCPMESNIVKSSDVYVLFFHKRSFAESMGRLKIPGEPLTFDEWRKKMKAGNQRGFGFIANREVRRMPGQGGGAAAHDSGS